MFCRRKALSLSKKACLSLRCYEQRADAARVCFQVRAQRDAAVTRETMLAQDVNILIAQVSVCRAGWGGLFQ